MKFGMWLEHAGLINSIDILFCMIIILGKKPHYGD